MQGWPYRSALLGILFATGCSGTYLVGEGTGAGGAATSSGGALPSAQAGAAQASGAPGATGIAGPPQIPGASGAPGTYCGVQLRPRPEIEFASRDEIWRRLQAFLGPGNGAYPDRPGGLDDRTWSAMSALEILFVYRDSAAPGMVRFVNEWLPFSTQADHWASGFGSPGFGSPGMTLRDLLVPTAAGATTSVLTDPGLLQGAHITRRGMRISSSLLCLQVPLPPINEPKVGPLPPGVSYRQGLSESLGSEFCLTCHSPIDPLGTSLEHFDLDGAYRTHDNGVLIDSSGTYPFGSEEIKFADQVELGQALSGRCEVAMCLTRQLMADALSSAGLPAESEPSSEEYENEIATIARSITPTTSLSTLLLGISQSNAFLAK